MIGNGETIETIVQSPADPKHRDWEGGMETSTNETIYLLATHKIWIPKEIGPA